MGPSALNRFLESGNVVLDEHRLTIREFLGQLVWLLPLCAVVVCFLLTGLLATVWLKAFEYMFHPLPILLVYGVFVFCSWLEIGERRTFLDLQLGKLVIESRMPSVRDGIGTTNISFHRLLLLRYWRRDNDSEAEAFVLSLLTSKYVGERPDSGGHVLHVELTGSNPDAAEAATAALAERFCSATRIDYFDIQSAKDEKYMLWSLQKPLGG